MVAGEGADGDESNVVENQAEYQGKVVHEGQRIVKNCNPSGSLKDRIENEDD